MIAGWRERIDDLDRMILGLCSRRAELACRIAREKEARNLDLLSPDREADILSALRAANPGPLEPDGVERIFRRIIDECRELARLAPAGGRVPWL